MGLHRPTIALMCCTLISALPLAGCDGAKRALGMGKQTPDEFAVVTRAPLTLPPDYGLRPPTPGAQRPQELVPREQARRILLGSSKSGSAPAKVSKIDALSGGEQALLGRANALNADPLIRQTVNLESRSIASADDNFLNKIIFWQDPEKPGTVVDAGKESRRLREAAALGDNPNKGNVPIIKRREKGLLEGIF